MLRFINLIAILLSLISFSVSAGYTDLSRRDVAYRLKLLNYDKNFTVKKVKRYRKKLGYDILKVKLESNHPWTKTKLNTEFFYYKSNKEGKRPLMIIVPPIVDISPLDKAMAHFFVEEGYNVLILKYNEKINDYERPLKDFNRALVSIITSARLLIDWAETKPEIDATKIGGYGMSLGALLLSIYVGVEPRVDAAIVIVGGGHMPQIMANSQQAIAADFRKARMKVEEIDTDWEFQKVLEDIVLFDPLFFAGNRNKEDIYMVIGNDDTAVPTKNQWQLWRAFGKPQHTFHNEDHFPAILKNLYEHKEIFDFLKKRLAKEDEKVLRRPTPPRGGFLSNLFNIFQ